MWLQAPLFWPRNAGRGVEHTIIAQSCQFTRLAAAECNQHNTEQLHQRSTLCCCSSALPGTKSICSIETNPA